MYRPYFSTLPVILAAALLAGCGRPAVTADKTQPASMSVSARERIASAAETSGDDALALSMYAAASKEAPANAQIQLDYADRLARSGQIEPARELLTRSLAVATDPMQIRQGLAMLDVLTGRNEQAVAELDKVLGLKPTDVRALVNKAVALDLQGHHAAAQMLYAQARGAAPEDPVIANDLALSLALDGKMQEAREVLLPFRNAGSLPERVKVTLRVILNTPLANGRPAQPEDEDIRRLSLALAGGAGAGVGSRN